MKFYSNITTNARAIPINRLVDTPLARSFDKMITPPLETFNPDNGFTILYDIEKYGCPKNIRKTLKNKPYLMIVDNKILVSESPTYENIYYPCIGNTRGFEFDSYNEPSELACLFKLYFTDCNSGIYFMPAVGMIETWDRKELCSKMG